MYKIVPRLVILVAIILVNPYASSAQTHKFEIGGLIGSNYSIPISKEDRFSWVKYLPGFNIGASVQYNLTPHISFRTSIFSEQHFHKLLIPSGQSFLHPANNEYVRYAINQSNSATFSLSTRFFFGKKTKFFLDGGFQFSRWYGYKTKTITDNEGEIKEYYEAPNPANSWRFVFSPGISIPLGNRITMTYELTWATNLGETQSVKYLNLFFMGGLAYNLIPTPSK